MYCHFGMWNVACVILRWFKFSGLVLLLYMDESGILVHTNHVSFVPPLTPHPPQTQKTCAHVPLLPILIALKCLRNAPADVYIFLS